MRTGRSLTFKEYLNLGDDGTDNRYELVRGELTALLPESGFNDAIANYLFLRLVNAGIPFQLIRPHTCELQVPVMRQGDPLNRFPDLVVLREEHLLLTQKRLTITLDMPPPQLVVEVISPGESNRERDLIRKRAQYCQRAIPEYWLIDPELETVIVLQLGSAQYVEIGLFRGSDRIYSPTFPSLSLTAEDLLGSGTAD
ncbi:Uma2 family endonuclease [Kovacikia minuta CCNUW1]|uniref:Uma2 family endonuclease n=1 Tax=Kovacikia minuta TaxID=2931930 RepID=UPI001CCD5923|nr:Uma2 family endonuclease [Kovacikia minuta]UBF29457.1 Uma2 family endonuclease [Kovacikia minuta CCNUW1]